MRPLAVLWVVACSSAPPPSFGAQPIQTMTSAACGADFTVFAAPDPIVRGASSLKLVATDSASSAPKLGLGITIVPFMPSMGHGSATTPAVVDQGDGVYLVNDVVMAMPGSWQLRTTIDGACSDTIVIDVEVQ